MNSENRWVANILETIERHRLLLLIGAVATLVLLGVGMQYAAKAEVSPVSPTSSPSAILVDVQGAVVVPGVRELAEGSLVRDALEAAGGLSAEADIDSFSEQINQAEQLKNHQKIYVPKLGSASPQSSDTSDGLINLNSASKEELDTLPGVGPATAQKILDYRESNGLFSSVDDLANVSGIGDAKLEKLRALVTI